MDNKSRLNLITVISPQKMSCGSISVFILMQFCKQVDRVSGDQPSLYELLLQRELLADKLDSDPRGHMMVRKSDRTPSLR